MKNFDSSRLKEKLEEAEIDRVDFPQHVYSRARKRNIDVEALKEKIRDYDFSGVRPNNQSDDNYDFSYKVTVDTDGRYEVPIYFNVPGHKLLVKSVWPR